MIPEQVWDVDDIPERGLYFGRPSGSAMPLGWAHAEYLKLRRSIRDGRVFDMPPHTVARYVVQKTRSRCEFWRDDHRCRTVARGKALRIESLQPALVRWKTDRESTFREVRTHNTAFGVHFADLPTANLPSGSEIQFTLVPVMESNSNKTLNHSSKTALVRVV